MSIEQVLFNERLDCDALMEMYEGDYEHAEVVFGQFIKNAPPQMQGIAISFEQDVVEEFRAKIHKLKPVFTFVGLTSLSRQAAQLEDQCKTVTTLKMLECDYQFFKNEFDTNLPLIKEIFEKLTNEV
jgi:HPt (histidine-containing phosphotransfer) domain-containing protein